LAVSAPWGAEVWSSAQPADCMEGDMNGSEPITAEHIVAAVLAHALIGRLGREPDATIAVRTWRDVLKAIRTADPQENRA
jgi:hypothetical protein